MAQSTAAINNPLDERERKVLFKSFPRHYKKLLQRVSDLFLNNNYPFSE